MREEADVISPIDIGCICSRRYVLLLRFASSALKYNLLSVKKKTSHHHWSVETKAIMVPKADRLVNNPVLTRYTINVCNSESVRFIPVRLLVNILSNGTVVKTSATTMELCDRYINHALSCFQRGLKLRNRLTLNATPLPATRSAHEQFTRAHILFPSLSFHTLHAKTSRMMKSLVSLVNPSARPVHTRLGGPDMLWLAFTLDP